ncbi:MAG TPA: SDR family oxidoreductase [Alphaproteobacteria bacterium]|nr:SDR family oxidoreductase [Alphaproteobacteria bacterium]
MTTVLITGASRGIGFGLARHHLESGDTVIAACRNPSKAKALKALKGADRLRIMKLDVTSGKSVAALKGEVGNVPIDILYNNAGIAGPHNQTVDDVDYEGWTETFETNTQGPLRVALAFKDNLKAAKGKIVNITSGLGSIAFASADVFPIYAYRSSKAALNMTMRTLALLLQKEGVTVILMNPGWVRTDMGGPGAPISVEESVAGIASTVAKSGIDKTGSFLSYDGTTLPW